MVTPCAGLILTLMMSSLLSLSLSLLLFLFLCQYVICTSNAENKCKTALGSNFTEDCDKSHLKAFSQCLHDANIIVLN